MALAILMANGHARPCQIHKASAPPAPVPTRAPPPPSDSPGAPPPAFEAATDLHLGGVLCGLPALCANGLFSGLGRHLSLPKGYYSALHILCVLGFMALARIRRPEQLRHQAPGELGKTVGLDRVPEVRTLREKIASMAATGNPGQWMRDLARTWMENEPGEAGYVYLDGHVRVYHGSDAKLPRRYVARQKLCLRGTTDYWINDALGRPFFVVPKAVTEGLATSLLDEILPELVAIVPGQPTAAQLAADPLLHRFIYQLVCSGAPKSPKCANSFSDQIRMSELVSWYLKLMAGLFLVRPPQLAGRDHWQAAVDIGKRR